MTLADLEAAEEGERDEEPRGGLLCGITPWHVRILIDDPWEGGRGQQLSEVKKMTLDQVLMALADRKVLKARQRRGGWTKAEPLAVAARADKDGLVAGRAADGTPIKGRIGGKSVARQLMEREAAKQKQGRKRRRRGR